MNLIFDSLFERYFNMPTDKKVAAKSAPKAKASTTKAAPVPKDETSPVASVSTSGFMKPLTPSAELAAIVGEAALPRTEVVKKLWIYIRANNLQDATKKSLINSDDKFKAVFGKDQVGMFEMQKFLSQHLK
jgi:chromatin remodeling complex protein RSC6